ncbi:glutathione hydrolase-like YwrD proenzyme [Bombina bombina]|uniref:glutathione hydrolase-like YwrD proenzyme n=1 Tax=Bombina bombina TaxID=8345 RepID=UPI00235AAC4B|nr:glutathione hydrolase-like YwrD proenzyme [Bombina bombina]XP_053565956.1 glutathione hydrolase-like YwrD proenzyme [Bombina bombina]XP_053565957.1 glutathione hydrolase-like YwrD proenzyme [Bombina bombina]XP_053565958.1 glutathione hydrolase-like YwrD proenzyme [Bombina bombina]XP_053565959.1 glutathione hydrolase-like YwrD proenzyme [Bombina bombina]XP_053565960.1 glutathione hydrolase-like YwrD proenzyme [Bombina bombina]XP_053565962.1 glutathione hydrolase-like YwrD proenzyme [Bombina
MTSELEFISRRSPIVCTGGCAASSQPLATNIGLDILKKGGNAADAAVAIAAALNVTEPGSTGLGGDCFCIYYKAETKQVFGLNGSGKSPKALNIDLLKQQGFEESNPPPSKHAHNVTVPGAAAAWADTVSLFGSKMLSLEDILKPAIELAENGFPVSEISAYLWQTDAFLLQDPNNKHGRDLLISGQPPQHGQIFRNPFLANSLKILAKSGKKGFYEGRIAKAIVEVVKCHGGVIDLEDLASHRTEEVQPIWATYKGLKVWELPPNGQGIIVLIALNILENFKVKEMGQNSADYLHTLIEALKLSISDCSWYCADPYIKPVPTEDLLRKVYAGKRSKLIDMGRVSEANTHGNPFETGSDTVYFTVVDSQGNACSFINSNYKNFGTGLVPEGCGFTLQNRGNSFSLAPGHPNCLGPGKRPFHTIIPAMVTSSDTQDLLCSFGVMGGSMQPQGHVQALLNMTEFGMNPQQALDAPRFLVEYSKKEHKWQLFLEDGISGNVAAELKRRGHDVHWPICGHDRRMFGRGQIITKGDWWKSWQIPLDNGKVWWAGSDPRGDGCALGY